MIPDLVLRGGTIADGTGQTPYTGDVAISDGRVVAVGEVPDTGAPELDVSGLVVAPGFIDIHSHSDYTLLVDPRAKSAIYQGVTLEVIGNCGHGCFPVRDVKLSQQAVYGYSEDIPMTWSSAGGYFERLEQAGPAVNVLSLVPNGQLRLSVLGVADRPATKTELAEMTFLLRERSEEHTSELQSH